MTPPRETQIGYRMTVLLVFGALGLFFAVGLPRIIDMLGRVRQSEMTTETALLKDAFAKGAPMPAESGATTTRAYLDLLIKDGWLRPGDRLFFREWIFTNVSAHDPPGTVFLVSRSYYEYRVRHRSDARGFGFVHVDGTATAVRMPPPEGSVALPPREPALLPPQ
jgi:hypothetical protein